MLLMLIAPPPSALELSEPTAQTQEDATLSATLRPWSRGPKSVLRCRGKEKRIKGSFGLHKQNLWATLFISLFLCGNSRFYRIVLLIFSHFYTFLFIPQTSVIGICARHRG